jgi:hypothetical protein
MTKTNKSFKFITVEVFWSQEDEAYIARPLIKEKGMIETRQSEKDTIETVCMVKNFSGIGLTRIAAVKELEIVMEGL